MLYLDEMSTRQELVEAALVAGFAPAIINAAIDSELLAIIQKWIAEGDECA